MGPKCTDSRTRDQAGGGSGRRQRRVPEGSAAYGTPRKTHTPASSTPRTSPAAVRVKPCTLPSSPCALPEKTPAHTASNERGMPLAASQCNPKSPSDAEAP